ncbi:alpha-galactosidase [Cohnella rhizosphaerae]|uniref:alpha-galactosidase n=1 Tax=Cohnella rhizosphaerae TaxID=1457232 RepID=A0A9X4QRU8_9BACL|nr:glycoside hydrolase family 36 N-terminal domain-containing protein [Cohnella rhizosphaerae]MDG0808945.1 alpha-galactosidase [Cohnella rhizosphaerae]
MRCNAAASFSEAVPPRIRALDSRVFADEAGARHYMVRLRCDKPGFEIESHTTVYEDEPVFERWLVITNVSETSLQVERVDPLRLELSEGEWRVLSYRSDWGAEFEPEEAPLRESFVAETRWGRSSKGMHPWVALAREDGALLHINPMWSGNWKVRCDRREDGGVSVSAGLNDWEFAKALAPGETMESPRVAAALGSGGDLHTVSIPLARVGRRHWYPRSAVSDELPAEWNHWFSYEDQLIDAITFKDNAAKAATLGFEACTLDAGWFGDAEGSLHWHDIRGDWDKVNVDRFPNGIGEISEFVRGLGMRFGLWCEIEGLGPHASLAKRRPSFPALRGGRAARLRVPGQSGGAGMGLGGDGPSDPDLSLRLDQAGLQRGSQGRLRSLRSRTRRGGTVSTSISAACTTCWTGCGGRIRTCCSRTVPQAACGSIWAWRAIPTPPFSAIPTGPSTVCKFSGAHLRSSRPNGRCTGAIPTGSASTRASASTRTIPRSRSPSSITTRESACLARSAYPNGCRTCRRV